MWHICWLHACHFTGAADGGNDKGLRTQTEHYGKLSSERAGENRLAYNTFHGFTLSKMRDIAHTWIVHKLG